MDKLSDLLSWIFGGLLTIVFIFFRQEQKSQSEKFKSLFEQARGTSERLGVVETKVDGFEAHVLKTVDEIKAQNVTMGQDLVAIKIVLASLPKRDKD